MVLKTHLQNSMNHPQKSLKATQNGKCPPRQDPVVNSKSHNQTSPNPSNKTWSRRRGRGGRKSDQGDACTKPSSCPCTAADKPVASTDRAIGAIVPAIPNVCTQNGGSLVKFPVSSKSSNFAPRPGYGQAGTKCIVKANHFFAELPQKDLNQYDVSSLRYVFHLVGVCEPL